MSEFHFTFLGFVQGVNFRKYAQELAKKHGVRGCIKNQSNGNVYLIAQGSYDSINALIEDLKNKFQIDEIKKEEQASTITYDNFFIER